MHLLRTLPPMKKTEKNILSFSFILFACLCGAILTFWRLNALSFFTYEDTFIFLRYAANYLSHGIFSWNVGEAPVEGYTSPLQLFLVTALGAIQVDLLLAARLTAFAGYLGLSGLLFFFFRSRLGFLRAFFLVLMVMAAPALILWCWGAMETTLVLFFLCLGHVLVAQYVSDKGLQPPAMAFALGIVFGCAALTRLDAMLFALPAGIAVLWRSWPSFRQGSAFAGGMAAMLLPHFIWRYAIYGDVLPNTFYTKVVGAQAANFANGLHYLEKGFLAFSPIYAAGLLALLALLRIPRARVFALYGLAGFALTVLYVAWVGGDFMPGYRFLLPLLPLAVLAFGLLWEQLKDVQEKLYAVALYILLLMHFVLPQNIRSLDASGPVGLSTGAYIAEHWPRGSLVALNPAGAIPYVNLDKRFVDMLGLNDKVIGRKTVPDMGLAWQKIPGHAKGDGAYVLSREPDFIILSSVAGDASPETPVFVSDKQLRELADFHTCYKNERVLLPWPRDIAERKSIVGDSYTFSYYRRICPKSGRT